MKFVCHRTITVASTSGLSVRFEKGEPTHVPPSMYEEVMAVGAVPEEDLPEKEVPTIDEPTDEVSRREAMFKAFETIAARTKREDYTAAGSPHQKAVKEVLGWQPHNKELSSAWNTFRAKAGE